MEIREGYIYHIKSEYFRRAKDEHLMRNKEHGGYRPALLCYHDEKTGLLWFVPLSSRVGKYQKWYHDQVKRYGKCITIELGRYGGRDAAFLIQNMFPALPEDIDHTHTIEGEARPVKEKLLKKIRSHCKKIRAMAKRGSKATFTDIRRLEKQLIRELEQKEKERKRREKREKQSLDERLADAEARARQNAVKKEQMRRGPPEKTP